MKQTLLFIFGVLGIAANSQNSCAEATPIVAGIHTVTGIDGSEIPNPICANNGPGADGGEWYTYTPDADYNVIITTSLPDNNELDTRFHVYVGTCGDLECYAGDDDSGAGYSSYDSFNVTAGTTYYIAFDDRWTDNGFIFQLTEGDVVVPVPSAFAFATQNISMPNGTKACVVDMNNDFLDDVVIVNQTSVSILYQTANSSGFTTVTIPTPNADFLPGWSIASGDIDGNGYNDLLYGSGNGVTFMKQNNTGNGFTEMSGPQNVFSQRSNFSDLNNDGELDAFVCHDVAPNVYYINDGSGNLTFNQGGMGDFPSGGNYGSIFVDYDNDGDSDLFIAKCRGGNSGANIDEMHRNDGNGNFTDVSIEAIMAEPSQSWSSAWADFDNDGWMDAMIGASSFASGGHKLRRNNGDGTFTDITAGSGFDTFPITNIEHVAHDFDNDGFVDIFCGDNTIMKNNGDLTFTPHLIEATNGAIGDLNNDGFLDIQNGESLMMNEGNDNNWIKVTMQGVESNRNGIGARVEIYGAWGKQIRDVRSGDGFRYMSSLNTHFGIGAAEEIEKVIIRWPSGTVDAILDPNINETLFVLEGSSPELGITNPEASAFSFYPNPAMDVVNIRSSIDEQITHAAIYDMTGKLVLSTNVTDMKISVRSLSAGTYVSLLQSSSGKKTSLKFVKR